MLCGCSMYPLTLYLAPNEYTVHIETNKVLIKLCKGYILLRQYLVYLATLSSCFALCTEGAQTA